MLCLLATGGQAYAASESTESTATAPVVVQETAPAMAATPAAPKPVAVSAADIEGDIRLSPDTTKIVKLDQDAASIIVTNQNNARVLLDTPRTLIIMPRTPGSTPLTVLNNKGETILHKNIIVTASGKTGYVRIRRMCSQTGSPGDCAPTSFYYCPDGCYEVSPVDPARDTAEVPAQQGGVVSTENTNTENVPLR